MCGFSYSSPLCKHFSIYKERVFFCSWGEFFCRSWGVAFPNIICSFYQLSSPPYSVLYMETVLDRTHSFCDAVACFLFRLENPGGCHEQEVLLRQPSTTAEFCLKRWQTRDIVKPGALDTSYGPIFFLTTKLDSSHYFSKKSLRNNLPSHQYVICYFYLVSPPAFQNVLHPALQCTKNFILKKSWVTEISIATYWPTKLIRWLWIFFLSFPCDLPSRLNTNKLANPAITTWCYNPSPQARNYSYSFDTWNLRQPPSGKSDAFPQHEIMSKLHINSSPGCTYGVDSTRSARSRSHFLSFTQLGICLPTGMHQLAESHEEREGWGEYFDQPPCC